MVPMDTLLRMAARVERALVRTVVIFLIVLVVGQAVISDGSGRWMMTFVNPLEGVPGAVPATARPAAYQITLALENRPSAPDVAVRVNGMRVAAFYRPILTVGVNPGDELAIDARCCREELVFQVVDVSPGAAMPVIEGPITTRGDLAYLGRVVWRNRP